jgi:hypothetical protein
MTLRTIPYYTRLASLVLVTLLSANVAQASNCTSTNCDYIDEIITTGIRDQLQAFVDSMYWSGFSVPNSQIPNLGIPPEVLAAAGGIIPPSNPYYDQSDFARDLRSQRDKLVKLVNDPSVGAKTKQLIHKLLDKIHADLSGKVTNPTLLDNAKNLADRVTQMPATIERALVRLGNHLGNIDRAITLLVEKAGTRIITSSAGLASMQLLGPLAVLLDGFFAGYIMVELIGPENFIIPDPYSGLPMLILPGFGGTLSVPY